jgi:hypothetical protein
VWWVCAPQHADWANVSAPPRALRMGGASLRLLCVWRVGARAVLQSGPRACTITPLGGVVLCTSLLSGLVLCYVTLDPCAAEVGGQCGVLLLFGLISYLWCTT